MLYLFRDQCFLVTPHQELKALPVVKISQTKPQRYERWKGLPQTDASSRGKHKGFCPFPHGRLWLIWAPLSSLTSMFSPTFSLSTQGSQAHRGKISRYRVHIFNSLDFQWLPHAFPVIHSEAPEENHFWIFYRCTFISLAKYLGELFHTEILQCIFDTRSSFYCPWPLWPRL